MTQAQFLLNGATRFEAEWVQKQYCDPGGEWNPDRDEYRVSCHSTKAEAEAAAIAASKQAGQVEWILVAEQRYIGHEWVDINRWTGDWDGLCEQTMTSEVEA